MKFDYDLAILGGGPGGYVAAIRAAQLGLKTALIDKDNLGGICLNWGCIPTKSLLKNAELYDKMKNHASDFGISVSGLTFDFGKIISRSRTISEKITKNVELLVKKNKIERIRGIGRLNSSNSLEVLGEAGEILQTLSIERILIATGARPKAIPQISIDHKAIITSTEAMSLEKQPESLIIIGGGAIGVEFAYFYSVLGTQVTIIEMLDRILPNEDEEISKTLEKSFRNRGIKIITSCSVKSTRVRRNRVTVTAVVDGKDIKVEGEKVLSAIGVVGNIENIGLEKAGIQTEKNFITVDKQSFRTNVNSVFAIGDVIGPPLLAHVASAEGICCVEKIAGVSHTDMDYDNVPACTYCHPPVASIGLTEKQAADQGFKIKVGKFPFMASGKAFAMGEREGFVKLIFDEKYGELLGAHIIGADATELIAELAIARALGATAETITKTIHAHPTLAESIMESAAAAYGESIHI